MPFVVDKWMQSVHARSYGDVQGNTYCARCHSPFQADPAATHAENEPVPLETWQAITCSVCHPPHDLRVAWGTPIALYDVGTGEYSPLSLDDANVQCEQCHSGARHARKFKAYGDLMFHKKDVRCIDCHMAKIPTGDEAVGRRASHTFNVVENLPWSCGTHAGGCHSNHKEEWALKQIQKGKIHDVYKTH